KHDPALCHLPVWVLAPRIHFRRARDAGAWGCSDTMARKEELVEALARLDPLASAPGRSLLVVGEDAERRRSVVELLRGGQLQIVAAATGAEGIEAMVRRPFDAVILGSGLPDRGGSEFVRELARLSGDSGSPPVILGSGSPGL